MKKEKCNRTRIIGLRLTAAEFEKIRNICDQTTTAQLSECLRRRIFDRPLTTLQRNQSMDDFMQELIVIRNQLHAIGSNINQAVKRLYTHPHAEAVTDFITTFQEDRRQLFLLIDTLQTNINQYAAIWLQ